MTQTLSDEQEVTLLLGTDPSYHSLGQKPQGYYPRIFGTLGISNFKRDLVPGQTAGLLPSVVTRAFVHPTPVFSSCAHSQGRNQVIVIKDSFNMRLDTISQSHHKSIDTESIEAFICHLEIF